MLHAVSDLDDPRLAAYRDLRHRETDTGFIAEGHVVVRRLLQSGLAIQSLLVHAGREAKYVPLVPHGVPIYLIDRDLGKQLAGYDFHRGVLAHGVTPPWHPIESLPQRSDTNLDPPLSLALIGLSDPENVGSLLRSAAALGVRDILIGPRTISPMTRRVIRVSMASVFAHRFYQLNDPGRQLQTLAQNGFATIATVLDDNAIPLVDLAKRLPSGPRVLMVGNEAEGLPTEMAMAATHQTTLPMQNQTDSLNVGVASAIFLYELTRGQSEFGHD